MQDYEELIRDWSNEQGFTVWACDHATVLRNLAKWLGKRGDGWVSVKTRMPNENEIVLASGYEYDNRDNPRWQIVSRFHKGSFESFNEDIEGDGFGYWSGDCYVTHWQPLPEPPKGARS